MTATLADIRTKVRRITKSPSPNQITDAQIDSYINTFYLYDFPEHLRLKDLFTNYVFTTTPNQDQYTFTTDTYVGVEPPLYIAGYQSFFTQSQTEFFNLYPKLPQIVEAATGTGIAGPYSFTLETVPVLQRETVISAVDTNGVGLSAIDVPLDQDLFPNQGTFSGDVTGTINYLTGAVTVTFSAAIDSDESINAEYVPYQASRPVAALFYDNTFTLRPVPDQSYKVSIAAYQTPTSLASAGDSPEIKQWWQLLAWGAALKIFEDRGDIDQIAQMRPLFDEQMRLAQRRTLVQMASERATTIYTEQTSTGFGSNFNQQF
jgi:hypothetical protein